jgi:hypothetical protein
MQGEATICVMDIEPLGICTVVFAGMLPWPVPHNTEFTPDEPVFKLMIKRPCTVVPSAYRYVPLTPV